MKRLQTTKSGQAAVELAIFGSLILLALSVLLMYGQNLDNQQQVKMEAFRRALQKAYERNGSVSYTLKKEGRSFNLFSGFGQGQSSTSGSTASVLWQKGMPGDQGSKKSEGYAYNAINDQEIGSLADGTGLPRYAKRQININGKEQTIWVTPSVYNEEQLRKESYKSTVEKTESPTDGIVNTRTSELSDTVTSIPYVRVDTAMGNATKPHDVVLPEYVYGPNRENNYVGGGIDTKDEDAQTVEAIPTVTLGAYVTADNRVSYNEESVGTSITKKRSWQTAD